MTTHDTGAHAPAVSAAATSRCTYLLTIRRVNFSRDKAEGYAGYFRRLRAAGCEVLVVDGSPPDVFACHTDVWQDVCRHVAVDPRFTYLNGKVNGIHTGVRLAAHDSVILADDDIRYTARDVRRMTRLLDTHDLVRPQTVSGSSNVQIGLTKIYNANRGECSSPTSCSVVSPR